MSGKLNRWYWAGSKILPSRLSNRSRPEAAAAARGGGGEGGGGGKRGGGGQGDRLVVQQEGMAEAGAEERGVDTSTRQGRLQPTTVSHNPLRARPMP